MRFPFADEASKPGRSTRELEIEVSSLRELAARLPTPEQSSVMRLLDTAAQRLYGLDASRSARGEERRAKALSDLQSELSIVRAMLEGRVGPKRRVVALNRSTKDNEMKTDSWRDDLTADELEVVDSWGNPQDDLEEESDPTNEEDDGWDDWDYDDEPVFESRRFGARYKQGHDDFDEAEEYLSLEDGRRRELF